RLHGGRSMDRGRHGRIVRVPIAHRGWSDPGGEPRHIHEAAADHGFASGNPAIARVELPSRHEAVRGQLSRGGPSPRAEGAFDDPRLVHASRERPGLARGFRHRVRGDDRRFLCAIRGLPRRLCPVVANLYFVELKPGDQAPAFSLPDEEGKVVSNKDLSGKPYVVYFYPKDDTPGCTTEACQFTDNFPQFEMLGVPVLGISRDDAAAHQAFRKKYGLRVRLLTDADKK